MSKNNNTAERTGAAYYLAIAGVLTLICAAVALMLGVVNYATKDVIAEGEEKAKKAAVYEIFPDAEDVFMIEGEDGLFAVKENGAICGYCVSTVTAGYGGDINLIVGITKDKEIKGVKIVSMSETAGLGSKTQSPSFLDQFKGMSGKLTVGDNVDAVSGATISSKAVTAGIEKALNTQVDLDAVAKELGIFSEEQPEESESSELSSTPAATDEETTSFNPNRVENSHIDPSLVGSAQNYRIYQRDDSYTFTKDTTGSYLEKETTDTSSSDESAI